MATIKEDVNAPFIITTAIISAIMLVVVIIGTHAWFLYEEGKEFDIKWDTSPNTTLVMLNESQIDNLDTVKWVDDSKTLASVPIDQAMKMVIETKGKLPTTQPTTQPAK